MVSDFIESDCLGGVGTERGLGASVDEAGVVSFEVSGCFVPKNEDDMVVSVGLVPRENGREVGVSDLPSVWGFTPKVGTNPVLGVAVVDGLASVEVEGFIPPNVKPPIGGAGIENVFTTGADDAGAIEDDDGNGDALPSNSF